MAASTTAKLLYALLGSATLLSQATVPPAKQTTNTPLGEKLFSAKCAPCHGNKAQGGAGYSKPLVGDLSVAQLAKFIKLNMPPGDKKLSQTEADSVAA